MRVIVCGSRGWADGDVIARALSALPANAVIVHGAGRGADTLAEEAARELGLSTEPHPANWGRFGRSAGPRRNAEMAEAGADLCLAFRLDGPSPGTDDMIRKCRSAGIPVEVHTARRVSDRTCSPGTHRGVRQPDGSLRCRACGASSRMVWRQQLLMPA